MRQRRSEKAKRMILGKSKLNLELRWRRSNPLPTRKKGELYLSTMYNQAKKNLLYIKVKEKTLYKGYVVTHLKT